MQIDTSFIKSISQEADIIFDNYLLNDNYFLKHQRVDVVDILDRWLAPDHRYLKVKGDDGATYIIRHDVTADQWELTLYNSGVV